jgi:hypothetical protein
MVTSPLESEIGLPTFRVSRRASSSACCSISPASSRSIRARCEGRHSSQGGKRLASGSNGRVGVLDAGLLELRDRLLGRRIEKGQRHRAIETRYASSPDAPAPIKEP